MDYKSIAREILYAIFHNLESDENSLLNVRCVCNNWKTVIDCCGFLPRIIPRCVYIENFEGATQLDELQWLKAKFTIGLYDITIDKVQLLQKAIRTEDTFILNWFIRAFTFSAPGNKYLAVCLFSQAVKWTSIDTLSWLKQSLAIDEQSFKSNNGILYCFESIGKRLDVLQWLLETLSIKESDCSLTHLEKLIVGAAKENAIEMLTWIHTHFTIKAVIENCMIAAAECASVDVLEFVKQNFKLKLSFCKHAFNAAVSKGHVCILEWFKNTCVKKRLYSHPRPDSSSKENAFVCAADAGHLDVIEWLYSTGYPIDASTIDSAFMLAAAAGHLKVLQLLLSRFDVIDCLHDPCITVGFKSAAGNGHLHVMKWIYSTCFLAMGNNRQCNLLKFFYENSEAFSNAALQGHTKVLDWLYSFQSLDKSRIRISLLNGVSKGKLESLQWLISIESNADIQRQAYIYAAAGCHLHILKWMCKNSSSAIKIMDQSHLFEYAFFAASIRNRFNMMRWLAHTYSPPTCAALPIASYALRWATIHRNIDMIVWLKRKFCLTVIHAITSMPYEKYKASKQTSYQNTTKKRSAFSIAAKHNNTDMLNCLTVLFSVTMEDIRKSDYECFITAAKNGSISSLNWLKSNFHFTDDDISCIHTMIHHNGKQNAKRWVDLLIDVQTSLHSLPKRRKF